MESRVHPNGSSAPTNTATQIQSNNSQNVKLNDLNNSVSSQTFISFSCFKDNCFNSRFKNVPLGFLNYLISKNTIKGFTQITSLSSVYTKYDLMISNDSYYLLVRSFDSQPQNSNYSLNNQNNSFAVSSPTPTTTTPTTTTPITTTPITATSTNKVNP